MVKRHRLITAARLYGLCKVMAWGYFPAVLLPVLQSVGYLRTGEWEPFSTLHLLQLLGIGWAYQPESWLGVHAILSGTPASFTLIVGTTCIVWPLFAWAGELERREAEPPHTS